MKFVFLCSLLFYISYMLEGRNIQNNSYYNLREIGDDKLVIDSTKMEYFPPEPRVIFKPKLIIPDSLNPIKKTVKVIVRVEVDFSGKPINSIVLKSTNKRFNGIAAKLALEYRFRPSNVLSHKSGTFIIIPMKFNKTK